MSPMEGKLQELTNKIYQEGVEKARKEAAEILAQAEQQANHLLNEARREAERSRVKAEEDAKELRSNVISELQLSARQAISVLRQEISGLVSARMLSQPLDEAFSDKEFLQKLIETAVNKWNPGGENGGLQVSLPESEREALGKYLEKRLPQHLDKGLQLRFDDRLQSGFRIGPADGSYVISFTPEDFDQFFRQYLRAHTSRLLFGEKTSS
jgi:V/A-type H+/Na+-transporting ATPase subunit E